jgi:hypothetical protein
MAEAFKEAQGEAEPVTRKDLKTELAPLKADITLVKWMLCLVLGGVLALILKAFFPS